MAENSSIAWTDHTWNPWRGCTKVSPACANCYAEALSLRYGLGEYKKGVPRIRTSGDNWKKPFRWQKKHLVCDKCGQCESEQNRSLDPICGNCGGTMHRARVFTLSLGDWLDDEVPIEWLADMMKVIKETPNLDWLLLTKRPENWRTRIHQAAEFCDGHVCTVYEDTGSWLASWLNGNPRPGIRIGITAENQKCFDERWEHAAAIPAYSRFISMEPMLEEINIGEAVCEETPRGYQMLSRYYKGGEFDPTGSQPEHKLRLKKEIPFHQIIVGGESGEEHESRTLNLDAVRTMFDQCRTAGIAFFMKQDSGYRPGMRGRIPDDLWVQEFPV